MADTPCCSEVPPSCQNPPDWKILTLSPTLEVTLDRGEATGERARGGHQGWGLSLGPYERLEGNGASQALDASRDPLLLGAPVKDPVHAVTERFDSFAGALKMARDSCEEACLAGGRANGDRLRALGPGGNAGIAITAALPAQRNALGVAHDINLLGGAAEPPVESRYEHLNALTRALELSRHPGEKTEAVERRSQERRRIALRPGRVEWRRLDRLLAHGRVTARGSFGRVAFGAATLAGRHDQQRQRRRPRRSAKSARHELPSPGRPSMRR